LESRNQLTITAQPAADINEVPWLKVLVKTSKPHSSFLDRWSYRLNFNPVKDTDWRAPVGPNGELPEVVVSLTRVEDVFGKL
jgi:hypothetical protein